MLLGKDLHGSTLGLVGMGQIARAVAKRAVSFGMKVTYWSRSQRGDAERCDSLEELLARSDFVSLHIPLSSETHYLINRERLRQMKPDAYLINTSRGPLVDEEALAKALLDGHLSGAALDVFEKEPEVHPLLLQ